MARNRLVWLVCLGILCVLPAGATFLFPATPAEWAAVAAQAGATINFTSLNVPVGGYYPTAVMGATQLLEMTTGIATVTFTSPTAGTVQVVNASGFQPWYDWGTTSILRSMTANVGPLKAGWATPVTAFAALMAINNGGATRDMDVKVYRSGETLPIWEHTLPTYANPTPTFFGIVATEGETFDSVIFTPAPGGALLDDIRLGAYNAPAPDPEPTPELGTGLLSLCGGILLAAGGFRRHLKT